MDSCDRLQELGESLLQRCYKVVFGCDWEVIESLVIPVFSGNWWEILGIRSTCTELELKKAYRDMAKRYHPDVNKSDAAKRAIQAINRAYEEGKSKFMPRNGKRSQQVQWERNDHRYENHALRSWITSSRQSICRRFKALCISLTSALTTTSFASVNAIDPTIRTLVKEA